MTAWILRFDGVDGDPSPAAPVECTLELDLQIAQPDLKGGQIEDSGGHTGCRVDAGSDFWRLPVRRPPGADADRDVGKVDPRDTRLASK
jgi:hypothetical protein